MFSAYQPCLHHETTCRYGACMTQGQQVRGVLGIERKTWELR
jgi:hypothetical protein